MAQESAGRLRDRIVTLESLQPPATESIESAAAAAPSPELESLEGRLRIERYYQIMQRLRQETSDTGSGVMITVPDRDVSRLQSELARRAADAQKLDSGGLEVKFGTGVGGGDWFGWLLSLMDHVGRNEAHAIERPTTTMPEPLPDHARIAMAADWGTGLYGAPKIAADMKRVGGYDLLLHLGDVYYSGTEDEVRERFLSLWPTTAGTRTVAANSNHEMYSGGFGYFNVILPAIKQPSSYLAFENANWLLVVLDTAYVDHAMDNEQVAWLNLVIKQSTDANGGDPKKLLLFSHQQLFSRLDKQGPHLQEALRHLLDAKAITAWYWGHEHQCVIYDAHQPYALLGRCLGHGGIPEVRNDEVKASPTEQQVGRFMLKRMTATADSPSCLVLDGPNPDIPGEEEKFVPHGYMTLEFDGPVLLERVLMADGTEIYRNEIR